MEKAPERALLKDLMMMMILFYKNHLFSFNIITRTHFVEINTRRYRDI